MKVKNVYIILADKNRAVRAKLKFDKKSNNYFAVYSKYFFFSERIPIPPALINHAFFILKDDKLYSVNIESSKAEEVRMSEIAKMLTNKIIGELLQPGLGFMLLYILIGVVAGIGLGYIIKDIFTPAASSQAPSVKPVG